MPLFKRRNKAGTAQGPVVETNPNISKSSSDYWKSKAEEPRVLHGNPLSKIANLSFEWRNSVARNGNEVAAQQSHNTVMRHLADARYAHENKNYSEAAGHFGQALGRIVIPNDHPIHGVLGMPTDVGTGNKQSLFFHHKDMVAALKTYASQAEKWHAENPVKKKKSILDDEDDDPMVHLHDENPELIPPVPGQKSKSPLDD